MRYSKKLINQIRHLRSIGKTYGEIQQILQIHIPKSSLSWQCKDVLLPHNYRKRIDRLNLQGLAKGRRIALEMNKIKREEFSKQLLVRNKPIAENIHTVTTAKIALAMLCLGEASKYNPKTNAGFYLGSSNPIIITLFLKLLEKCFPFDRKKIRCTVQCRADQNMKELQKYWRHVTNISASQFYKPQIDPRTKGKPTNNTEYKGVLRVDYFDRNVQLELESLAELVYNQVHSSGPVA